MENNIAEDKNTRPARSSDTSSEDYAAVEKLDSKIVKVRDSPDGDEAFAHLPDYEKAIVKRQLDIPPVKVTFVTLYRYATKNDLLILVISAVCAIIGGAVMPLMTVWKPRKPLKYCNADSECRSSSVNWLAHLQALSRKRHHMRTSQVTSLTLRSILYIWPSENSLLYI